MSLVYTSRTLLAYVLLGLSLILSPLGWFFLLTGVGCFLRNKYCFKVWYQVDVLLCTMAHGTKLRTISGWSGQHAYLKRYLYQRRVIDFLAKLCGDGPNHCQRAFEWEREQGWVTKKS